MPEIGTAFSHIDNCDIEFHRTPVAAIKHLKIINWRVILLLLFFIFFSCPYFSQNNNFTRFTQNSSRIRQRCSANPIAALKTVVEYSFSRRITFSEVKKLV